MAAQYNYSNFMLEQIELQPTWQNNVAEIQRKYATNYANN